MYTMVRFNRFHGSQSEKRRCGAINARIKNFSGRHREDSLNLDVLNKHIPSQTQRKRELTRGILQVYVCLCLIV